MLQYVNHSTSTLFLQSVNCLPMITIMADGQSGWTIRATKWFALCNGIQ